MLWQGRAESDNVDDQRGLTGGGMAAGGGVIGVIFLLAKFFLGGGNVSDLQQALPQGGQGQVMTTQQKAADDERANFVKVVLKDTEDVWDQIFQEQGKTYSHPRLVLFRDAIQSGCGGASSASGPFYCPQDRKVYIDLSFADELKNRFGVNGDFAMAYVVAHEVGHHVQNLLGVSAKMEQLQQQLSPGEYNKYSVMLELQADFYAGVWAKYDDKTKHVIEKGDIEQALTAANAIGDDRLQKQATGTVNPDSFTHGTSAQRMYWFKKGYDTGDISQGDTFHSDK
ncbi:MAG: neutral zinc metallopeptidase [Ginsengibacter sp.]